MNKTTYWILGTGVGLGLLGLMTYIFMAVFIGAPSQEPGGSSTQSNSSSNNTTVVGTTGGTNIVVPTTGGSTATTNFLNDPAVVKDSINPGHYFIGPHPYIGIADSTATESPTYIIEYIQSDNSFTIGLLTEPIATTREDAERELTKVLGLGKDQMCQLNYMVSVPSRVNAIYSGKNLGFSFCPGATTL